MSMTTRVEIKAFDGDGDFSLWKIRMMAQLGVLGLKNSLFDSCLTKTVPLSKSEEKKSESSETESGDPQTKEVPDHEKIDKSEQAKNIIINHISDTVLRKVNHCETAAEIWALLNKLYMETSLPNRIYVQQKFYSFKMNESQTIDQNVDVFLKMVAELGSLDIQVAEEVQAILILNSLPTSYSQLKHTLKYGNKTLTVQEVVSSAKSSEREMSELKESEKGSSTVLYTTERGRPVIRTQHKGSKGKGRSRSNSRTKLTCWFCKKEGHVKKDCYARKRKLENEEQGEAGVITEKLEFSEALSISNQLIKDIWVLDSGCTSHMTSRRDWFCTFEENEKITILLGDDRSVESKGQGSIRLNTHGGSVKVLNNVKYVPNLRRNLISTGTLDKLGFNHEGGNGKVRYFKNNTTALCGNLKNGLYVLDGETITESNCNVEKAEDRTWLWHSRLGHLSLNSMKTLSGKCLLEKNDVKDLSFCEHCVMGKSKHLSFNVSKHNTEDILGYIHADLWGSPNVTPSHSGKQYFLSIIDDKSRKVWLMFLKTKDETFQKFCEWKDLVENQVGKKIKILRTDNGLEFCNTKFNEFCKTQGIERHRTCTYTPQQNGIAERMNRTLMEKVRCLLNESGLEEEFWAEAAATAAYLVNRSPASGIDHNVPEELWLNRKPGYKHLRRFGSIAYVHQDQGKLKPRALKGVFLGYPQGTKGYRIWLLDDRKVVISRNVIFHEDVVYKDLHGKVQNDEVDNSDQTSKVLTELKKVTNQVGESSNSGGVVQIESSDSESDAESVYFDPAEEEAPEMGSSLKNYQLARDRVRRPTKAPVKFSDYSQFAFALIAAEEIDCEEPKCFHEAKDDSNWEKWNSGMDDEIDSLLKNSTWDIVDRPKDQRVISSRWLYKKKPGIPGVEPERYKARLVARGFTQRKGIDYNEVFAPVVKHISIRILMSIVVDDDLELEQMDVKTAFLHGELDKPLYMEQPEGYVADEKKDQVCLLKRSLYGLKQAPRQWNKKFNSFITEMKFARSCHDSCVYIKEVSKDEYVYLLIYVDDILLAAKSMREINKIKEALSKGFEMKDMGAASRILGIDITRDREQGILCLSQSRYLEKVLQRFNMSEAKTVSTPMGAHFKLASVKEEAIADRLLQNSFMTTSLNTSKAIVFLKV